MKGKVYRNNGTGTLFRAQRHKWHGWGIYMRPTHHKRFHWLQSAGSTEEDAAAELAHFARAAIFQEVADN